jgi:hypothetical protein
MALEIFLVSCGGQYVASTHHYYLCMVRVHVRGSSHTYPTYVYVGKLIDEKN